jgi:hypothetical protein
MVKHKSPYCCIRATLGAITLTTFGAMAPAHAVSTKTKRNIAIGAGCGNRLWSGQRQEETAIVGGVATAGSYLWYRNSKKREEARRMAWYQQRYGRNWRNYYSPAPKALCFQHTKQRPLSSKRAAFVLFNVPATTG